MATTIRGLQVSFGLVSFPASLRKASEKKDVTFDSAVRVDVDGEVTYERVVQSKSGASTGAVAASATTNGADVVKGLWVDDDTFHPLPEGALDSISESTQIEGIEIEEFVPLKDVPWHRVEAAYYLTPQKGLIGAKPMRLLRDALKAEKTAGVCKLCLKAKGGRQKLAVVHEQNGMLLVNLLSFAADFREADESARAVENVEVKREMLTLARQMIRERVVAESVLLTEAVDDAVAERERLYTEAADRAPEFKPKSKPRKAEAPDDLMAALEASIQKTKAERKAVTA